MTEMITGDVVALLTRELDGFKRELALFPDDQSVWRTVPGVTNSAGNLALHIAGGLQYLVGGVLGAHRVRPEPGRRSSAADREPDPS